MKISAHWLLDFAPSLVSRTVTVDAKLLLFLFGLGALAILTIGVFPAWRSFGKVPMNMLRSGAGILARNSLIGKSLVVIQIALSVILLIGFNLFHQSYERLAESPAGFESHGLNQFRLLVGPPQYAGESLVQLIEEIKGKLSLIIGVKEIAYSRLPLVGGGIWSARLRIPGRVDPPDVDLGCKQLTVSEGYFRTMGIRILLGREFDERDNASGVPVVVVNEAFAKTYFPGINPIGMAINLDTTGAGLIGSQIVGVCADTKLAGLRAAPVPIAFAPFRQIAKKDDVYWRAVYFHVRAEADGLALGPSIANAVKAAAPLVPMADLKSQEEILDAILHNEKTLANISGFLASVAAIVSMIGIYSLTSFSVTRRTREIGIRMALGAGHSRILVSVVGGSLLLFALGCLVGIPTSLYLSQMVKGSFFEISPNDVRSLAVGALFMLVLCVCSAIIPAIRAIRIDPAVTMKEE